MSQLYKEVIKDFDSDKRDYKIISKDDLVYFYCTESDDNFFTIYAYKIVEDGNYLKTILLSRGKVNKEIHFIKFTNDQLNCLFYPNVTDLIKIFEILNKAVQGELCD